MGVAIVTTLFICYHDYRCNQCNCQLNLGSFNFCKGQSSGDPGKFFCPAHYRQLFLSDPTAINYGRSRPEDWGKEKTPVGVAKEVTPPIPEEEEEEDEETVQEKKIKRSLTKRLSSYFKRRSRRSKSPSPEKRVSVKRASSAAEPMMEEEVEETEKEVEKEDSLPAIVESPLPAMRNRSRIIKRPGASPPMRVVSSLSPDCKLLAAIVKDINPLCTCSKHEAQWSAHCSTEDAVRRG